MKLVVGLGNVGKRYAHTRHNIGFMVADELLRQFSNGSGNLNEQIYGLKISGWKSESKLQAELATVELPDDTIVLAKPTTMMNLSGDAVQRLMQKYRLKPSDVWVMYDDVDVPFGKLRIRHGATSGQQGIRSITGAIGSNFVHVRLGISLNDRAVEPSEVYVLKPFNEAEQTNLPTVIANAASSIMPLLSSSAAEDTTVSLLSEV